MKYLNMILQRSRDFTSARRSRSNSPWQIMNRRISDRVPQYCPSIMMFFTHFNAQNDDVRRSIDPSRRLFPRFRVLFKWSDSSETAAALRAFSCSGEVQQNLRVFLQKGDGATCSSLSYRAFASGIFHQMYTFPLPYIIKQETPQEIFGKV